MEWRYTTRQGDTWDTLALDIYGSEKLAWLLQQANSEMMDLLFFPAGLTLIVPETPPRATAQPAPPWARQRTANA